MDENINLRAANGKVIEMTNGKPAVFIVKWDGRYINNPKDWIQIPDEAMPAVRFIIEEVERDGYEEEKP